MKQWAKKEITVIKNGSMKNAKVISEKNSAGEKMLQRETRANCERYQELRRKANRICKEKKGKNEDEVRRSK
jgi:hypothetical protein